MTEPVAGIKFTLGEWIVIAGSVLIIAFAVVVGSIIYLKPPPVRFTYQQTPGTLQGEIIYRREGCLSCHEIFGNGASYGPSLDGVGSKRTKEWLIRYLKSPWGGVSAKPYRLKMLPYDHLPENDLDSLAEYLLALKSTETNFE